MEMKPDTKLSRRAFLAGGAAMAAGAMAPTLAAANSPSQTQPDDWPTEFVVNPAEETDRFNQPGRISRGGFRKLAETEYRAQQQGTVPTFSNRVHAVDDLGLDPNDGEPVQNKIASAAESGMLIVCPKGSRFRVTGDLRIDVDGSFGIVGEGYKTSKHPPGPDDEDAVIFNIDNSEPTTFNFRVSSGLFANSALDQRGPKQLVGMKFMTDGYILGRDLRTIGPQSHAYSNSNSLPAGISSVTSSNATVRINRYTSVGGGKSGTKRKSGVVTVWAGASHHGTLQLIDCHVENSANNGAYCGRTPGRVQVFRGLWRNNDVSQIRLSGQGSWVDGTEIELDEENYTGLGTKKGFPSSNGVKWDGKPTRSDGSGGKIVNCDIRGISEVGDQYGVGSLIAVFSTAGAVTVKNTRIVNKIDAMPISADVPNGNDYPPPPKPWRVVVKHSLITGRVNGRAISIIERPNSLVSDSCLKYQGASPADIFGAKTSNVGYGKCGPNQGLSAPKKVGGSPGSGLPPVNVTYSGTLSNTKKKRKKKTRKMSIFATGVLVVLVIIAAVVILPFLIAGFSIFVTLLVAYISTDDD